jgi:DHA3 family macrolide efflux protein-like MFS transporter
MNLVRHMKTFLVVWSGQSVSMMGSGLTRFALGVWVFERTGSVTQFALIFLFALLPYTLISPLAGTLVDRWDRRRVMIISDAGAGLSTLAIALLLFLGQFAIWHVYVVVSINAFFSAFQEPAYAAVMPMLVPKEYLDRANGFVQMELAISRLIVPAVAGVLITTIQLQGIMIIDGLTFIFAITTLLFVRFPTLEKPAEAEAKKRSFWGDMVYGWTYLKTRPGLLGLVIFYALVSFIMGAATASFTPLVLNITSAQTLGFMWSVAGGGMIVSSLILSARGGPKRQIHGVLGFAAFMGIGTLLIGSQPSVVLMTIGLTLVFISLTVFQVANQTILQRKVDLNVQGRVFALRGMLTTIALPIVYISAGSLADRFFEPLLAVDGALADSVGALIGVGAGRGIGFMFVLMGLLMIVTAVLGYLFPRLRLVEDELPDHSSPADADAGVPADQDDSPIDEPELAST